MKALFIGGAADGQWREVAQHERKVKVIASTEPAPPTGPDEPPRRFANMVILHHDEYTAHQFGGMVRLTRVFVLDRLSVDDAMDLLIAFYQIPGQGVKR